LKEIPLMKKSLLIVASLALGTAAFAQTQTPAEQGSTPSESSQSPGAQSMPTTPDSAGSTAGAPAGGDMSGAQGGMTPPAGGDMSGGQGMSPGGMSSGGNMGAAQQAASSTDTSNYPKCSKTVTDKCVSAGGMGGHKTMHHRMMRHKKPA
jgi:translation initiation factor IF-2/pilus assembly protein FimV